MSPNEPYSPLLWGAPDTWTWSRRHKSTEVRLHGPFTAQFHPNWSNGTAAVRCSRPLAHNRRTYWEIRVSQRVFGTSMMFGVATRSARLHANTFVNLLGEDQHGWGLSHKGLLWHAGRWRTFTRPFPENEATVVGMLYDGRRGTLTYYKDGVCLGVAFEGLAGHDLYPVVSSTAAKTEMTLGAVRREFVNLQDRCRAVILNRVRQGSEHTLTLPSLLKRYILEGREIGRRCDVTNGSLEGVAPKWVC
ncbi:SPRY domain-containing SOCS box protein 3-like [Ornithodoros turicata]|uniref:SPRY domain-containing SOCS box protein 3-like n=1 Tax=Ornithodoros turicata TaxID=34597 RepID=UPI003139931F